MGSNQSQNKNLSLNKDQLTQIRVSLPVRTSNDYAPTLLKIPGPDLNNSSLTREISKKNLESEMNFFSSFFLTLRTRASVIFGIISVPWSFMSKRLCNIGRFSSRRARPQILFSPNPLSQFPSLTPFQFGILSYTPNKLLIRECPEEQNQNQLQVIALFEVSSI